MRLLFISEHYPPEIGGVAASAKRIARTVAALGHEVHAFALARDLPSGAARSDEDAPGLVVHRFGRARNLDFTLRQALNFLEWLHKQHTFDATWGHYVETAGFLAAWIGRLWNVPSILAVRGNDLDRQLFPPGDAGRLEWALRSATRIVAVSADLAGKVRAFVDRYAVVLPNAVDPECFRPGDRPADLMERYAIRPEELVLAFSGELRAKKGLVFLMEAFRQLQVARPCRLLLIGEVRGKDRGEYIRATASDPDLERAVTVTGHLSDPRDVARHLLLADVFLLPSLWDGMPNSLLEAMAAGVPVIASDAGGIPEVIRDGQNGLLVPRTHLHLLADRVDELLAMPARRRNTLTAAARQTILDNHSPGVERTGLAAILTPVASGGPTGLSSGTPDLRELAQED